MQVGDASIAVLLVSDDGCTVGHPTGDGAVQRASVDAVDHLRQYLPRRLLCRRAGNGLSRHPQPKTPSSRSAVMSSHV